MPVYTVVGTQYCAPRSGFLRLRRGPTRTSAARTLRITSRSKAEAVRMYRKAIGVGRDCELKVYASPESVQPNRRRTSRRVRPNSRRRSSRHGLSRNYAALVRAGAQGAVRLAQSPAVRKAVTAAAPYAIEVAKTGATALQTKLQAKLRKFGGQEAANRRR